MNDTTEDPQPTGVRTLRAVTELFEHMQCHDGYALVTYTDLRNLAQRAQRFVIEDLERQLGADGGKATPLGNEAVLDEIIRKGRKTGHSLPLSRPRALSVDVIPSQQRARRFVDQILGKELRLFPYQRRVVDEILGTDD